MELDFHSRPRLGLDGLSPDYRIQLGRWYEASRPHFRPILGPSIAYFFLFLVIYSFVLLLHYIVIGFLLDPFLIPALAIGMHIVCQMQLKEKPWSFSTFFSGFRYTWPLAARAILLLLVPVVLALPFLTLMGIGNALFEREPPPPIVIITLIALGATSFGAVVYVSVRLSFFSHFLIIDRECGPIQALKGSWILSRGHFWGLFGTMLLVLMSLSAIALCTLGIGTVFALPRAVLMLNAGYLLVAGSEPFPAVGPRAEPARSRQFLPVWVLVAASVAAFALFGILANAVDRAVDSYRQAELLRKYEQDQQD